MIVPPVGATVRVRYSGVVRESSDDRRGGFWLTVPADALMQTPETSSWVPPVASYEVLRPAVPREVLLLECGHVTDVEVLVTALDGARSSWCHRCGNHKALDQVVPLKW